VRTQSARSHSASNAKKRRSSTASSSTNRSARGPERARSRSDATGPPATPARGTIISTMKELPNFLRLLGGLMTDKRVSNTDKLLVGGAIAYILLPMDFIPDYIPFLGEIDDLFVLVLALQRLIANAGRSVIEDHWMGDPAQLRSMDLERVLVAAAFFLPRRVRRRLRTIGREV
jgi:uncharacterized membrane protein YkvA (DUF1232 family)